MPSKQSHNALIQVKEVKKVYPVGANQFVALNNINLKIAAGEFVGITGKSGAGKSTLLNMITGVSALSSGEVLYFGGDNSRENGNKPENGGISIHNLPEDQLAIWRGKNVGIVYQSFEMIPSLTLLENIMFPPDLLGTYDAIISKEEALHLLEQVEIAEHANKIPAHISGGQLQRVAIARALVNAPSLIVADEPTGNLDSVTAETIFQLFETLVESGKTIIMVTHDESMAPRFSKRYHIIDGNLAHVPKNQKYNTVIPSSSHQQNGYTTVEQKHEKNSSQKSQLARRDRKNSSLVERNKHRDYPAISMNAVNKTYKNAAGEFVALKSVDLNLDYGQFISIVGKSGSGKSTLINMVTGIDHPSSGEIIVGNVNIYKMNESERALWRGKNMGVVFQFFQLLPTLTLLENTILPMDYCNVYPFEERPKRALELLKKVGLEKQANQLPGSVSSGQQQSAAIARSLATDPSIILADEPTGNLDSQSAEVILSLFEELAKEGKTIIIVTHDASITERTDQTIILSDGEIIDETIAATLPTLSHPQMLVATHQAMKRTYAPNELILGQAQSVDNFYMIAAGGVKIGNNQSLENNPFIAKLGPGEYFGEVELMSNNRSIAEVRASSQGAQLTSISRKLFTTLVEDSVATKSIIQQIANHRLNENKQVNLIR